MGDDDEQNGEGTDDEGSESESSTPWDEYESPAESAWPTSATPGELGLTGRPPADAVTLWDGDAATLDDWEHGDGSDAQWIEHDDYFEVDVGTGDIHSRESVGDCHLHLEWRIPAEYEGFVDIDEGGDGQGPGNSGVFLMETYEVQILQSHDNPTYPGGYAGGFYLASPDEGAVPLVLPTRPPGEWNAFDIVWRGPRFDGDELERYPQLTVFFNGVAVVNHFDVPGPAWWVDLHDFDHEDFGHPRDDDGTFLEEVPVQLQDHGAAYDECHFRNIWYRDLPESPVDIDDPDEMPEYDSDRGVWEERDEYSGHEDSWDPDHPDQPEQIEAGGDGTTGEAPGDADVLIDGEETLEPGDGGWESDEAYGDCQVHVEWQVDADAEAEGPWRGNSGIGLGDYRIQILDNYDNPTDPEDWAGAYPGQAGPELDAVGESGEWQHLDLVFQAPRDGGDRPAQVTAFLNGAVVQTRLRLEGPNADGEIGDYEDHGDLPLRFEEPRENGSEVSVRNAWVRSLN